MFRNVKLFKRIVSIPTSMSYQLLLLQPAVCYLKSFWQKNVDNLLIRGSVDNCWHPESLNNTVSSADIFSSKSFGARLTLLTGQR